MVATACASCMCVWTEGNCVQFYPVALVGFGVLFLSFLSNFILYSWTFAFYYVFLPSCNSDFQIRFAVRNQSDLCLECDLFSLSFLMCKYIYTLWG